MFQFLRAKKNVYSRWSSPAVRGRWTFKLLKHLFAHFAHLLEINTLFGWAPMLLLLLVTSQVVIANRYLVVSNSISILVLLYAKIRLNWSLHMEYSQSNLWCLFHQQIQAFTQFHSHFDLTPCSSRGIKHESHFWDFILSWLINALSYKIESGEKSSDKAANPNRNVQSCFTTKR